MALSCLLPAGLFWQIILRARWFLLNDCSKKPERKIPLWCFGNVVVGGAGKTPALLAVSKLLEELSFSVACISKGYGKKTPILEPLRVDPEIHTAGEVGDEPLLLARHLPTFVCDSRAFAYQVACASGADFVFADDGLQDPRLFPTNSFLIFDGNNGLGNGWFLPAGPVRESLKFALSRCFAVLRMSDGSKSLAQLEIASKPTFEAIRSVDISAAADKKLIAFAGIANPAAFFQALPKNFLLYQREFPDHYFYQEKDLLELEKIAQKNQALMVTTEKDFVRLPKHWRDKITVLNLHVEWKNKDEFLYWLRKKSKAERL